VARSRRHCGAEAFRIRRLLRLEVELRRGEERVRSEPVELVDDEGEFGGEGGEEFREFGVEVVVELRGNVVAGERADEHHGGRHGRRRGDYVLEFGSHYWAVIGPEFGGLL